MSSGYRCDRVDIRNDHLLTEDGLIRTSAIAHLALWPGLRSAGGEGLSKPYLVDAPEVVLHPVDERHGDLIAVQAHVVV